MPAVGAHSCGRAAELAALREENEALRDALRRLSLQAVPAEVARGLQVGLAAHAIRVGIGLECMPDAGLAAAPQHRKLLVAPHCAPTCTPSPT